MKATEFMKSNYFYYLSKITILERRTLTLGILILEHNLVFLTSLNHQVLKQIRKEFECFNNGQSALFGRNLIEQSLIKDVFDQAEYIITYYLERAVAIK